MSEMKEFQVVVTETTTLRRVMRFWAQDAKDAVASVEEAYDGGSPGVDELTDSVHTRFDRAERSFTVEQVSPV